MRVCVVYISITDDVLFVWYGHDLTGSLHVLLAPVVTTTTFSFVQLYTSTSEVTTIWRYRNSIIIIIIIISLPRLSWKMAVK